MTNLLKSLPITKADVLVLVLSAALLVTSYIVFFSNLTHAEQFEVYASEQFIGRYSLHENRIIHLDGQIGDSTLQVADGKVRFIASPCKSKYCIHQGWLTSTHAFNACLPNEVSIQLVSSNHYDAINF